LNFLAHTLAQRRYHSNESEEDRRTLSFAPKLRPYKEEDGKIVSAEVVGFQKRYSPEKYYVSYKTSPDIVKSCKLALGN